jgi:hypothetical protein
MIYIVIADTEYSDSEMKMQAKVVKISFIKIHLSPLSLGLSKVLSLSSPVPHTYYS